MNKGRFLQSSRQSFASCCGKHLGKVTGGGQPLLLAVPNQILELEFEPGKPNYSRQGNFHVLAPATQRFRNLTRTRKDL